MARPTPVPDWVPPDLPTSPGVYFFRDSSGNPLYIGKSVNLRRRVRGYFYGGGPDNTRLAEMLRIARGVTALPTGSDLEARLEEADRIIRLEERLKGIHEQMTDIQTEAAAVNAEVIADVDSTQDMATYAAVAANYTTGATYQAMIDSLFNNVVN